MSAVDALIPVTPPTMPVARIADAVARVAGVSVGRILGRDRRRDAVRARQVVVLLARETARSSKQISRVFETLDHSDVLYHTRQAKMWQTRCMIFAHWVLAARQLLVDTALDQPIPPPELIDLAAIPRPKKRKKPGRRPLMDVAETHRTDIAFIEQFRKVRARNALDDDDSDAVRRFGASCKLAQAIAASGGGFR